MIITISGKVTHKGADLAVIEAAGLGYQVFLNVATLEKISVGSTAKLWTHEYLREDARELYGFLDQAELRLFGKLLAVSGVGPKMALHILDLGSVAEIEKLIDKGDVDMLSRVPRVGKKTAQKIVLELKGRLVEPGKGSGESDEVLAALVDLGYGRDQAKEALSRIGDAEKTVEERLKAALRYLGRGKR
jgi:Holliday junction DNA helicase RuvA